MRPLTRRVKFRLLPPATTSSRPKRRLLPKISERARAIIKKQNARQSQEYAELIRKQRVIKHQLMLCKRNPALRITPSLRLLEVLVDWEIIDDLPNPLYDALFPVIRTTLYLFI